MGNKVTAIKYCRWCGNPFEVKSPNQKYCNPNKRNCSKEAKRESWRKAASKYRRKYKDVLQISQVYKLGSGFLGSKPHENFDEEYYAILKEKKRLKLNGILIGLSTWIQFTYRPLMESPLQRHTFSIFEFYLYLLIFGLLVVGALVFGLYSK